MHCIKCHSPRIIRFLDGFGNARVFCKTCQESILVKDAIIAQKSIMEFGQTGINIPRRWDYAGTRKIGSFITPR